MDLQTKVLTLYQEHTLLCQAAAATVAFRLLSHLIESICKNQYKNKTDVAIATYRLTGLVHHIIQVPLAFLVLSDSRMWTDRLFSSTSMSTLMVLISTGYFVHDAIHSVENVKVQGVSYVIHGAGCAAVYLFSLLQKPTMLHFYGAGFLMWEISSFFVHYRWFLFKMNGKKPLQLLNGLMLLITFFGARIVWGFYLSYMFFIDILAYKEGSKEFVYTLMLSNVALNVLNTYWFILIFNKAVEALSGKKHDSLGKRD